MLSPFHVSLLQTPCSLPFPLSLWRYSPQMSQNLVVFPFKPHISKISEALIIERLPRMFCLLASKTPVKSIISTLNLYKELTQEVSQVLIWGHMKILPRCLWHYFCWTYRHFISWCICCTARMDDQRMSFTFPVWRNQGSDDLLKKGHTRTQIVNQSECRKIIKLIQS